MTPAAALAPPPRYSALQLAGLALCAIMALYMAANTARALLGPAAFAESLGAPLADPADTGFVHVYAFRAAFLALLVGWLTLRREIRMLRLVALVGVVMPLGDAALTLQLGAPTPTVARHVVIAAVLVVVWALLGANRKDA